MSAPQFDLDRYLDRIGLDRAPRPDLEGLVTVQAAQLRAVPFENFDVLLRGGVDVEPSAIVDKLVRRGRGGYCFECNVLLREALRAMGFEARTLLGRVVVDREDGSVPPRTHAIVEVLIGETHYAVDCGFGAQTPRAPLQIMDGAEGGDGGRGWRLRADAEHGWRVIRTAPGEPPRNLYVFDRSPVYPADIALGNHWTSTHPSSHFTQRSVAVRHTDVGRLALNGRRLIEHVNGEMREHTIANADALWRTIHERLGIPLENAGGQADRLWAASAPGDESAAPPRSTHTDPRPGSLR